ncbi:MAG: sigma-54-dependent Fis family transcriptional regulator [Myxococcota bacterium]
MDLDLPGDVTRGLDRLRTVDAAAAEAIGATLERVIRAADALAWARDRLGRLAQAPTETAQLQALVDEAVTLTGAPEAWALTWAEAQAGSQVRALAGRGAGRTADGSWLVPSDISRSVLGRVARERRPAWSDDAMADARFLGADSVQALALRSVGCVPIGEHGALYLHDPSTPGRFTADARSRIAALCALAAELLPRTPMVAKRSSVKPIEGLVGDTPAMRELYSSVRAFAPMPWPVLILGETGTGKEAVAHAVHDLSGNPGPFVAVNAGTIDPELAESTLFGHERGAFTGAARARGGLVVEANQGTLFLDEVGELPGPVQTKLLRLLQEGVYRRVGADEERTFDGRVVAATHRAIGQLESGFRADLYHRLSACVVRTPPLRERLGDLPALVGHLLQRSAREVGIAEPQVAPDVLPALRTRSWPGNVRELDNALKGALARVAARGDGTLVATDLTPVVTALSPPDRTWPADLVAATERFQQQRVREALSASGGNRTRAAEALGVSRQWLHRLIARWDRGGPW